MKVGDRVRFLPGSWMVSGHEVGDVGLITHVYDGDDAYEVSSNDSTGYYVGYELEVIAPKVPDFGIPPAGLAAYVGEFIAAATARVNGPGAEQYFDGAAQKFERMTPLELVEWAREEAQDLAVYAAMLDIRLARVRNALKGVPGAN